jgi:hypothetical protein
MDPLLGGTLSLRLDATPEDAFEPDSVAEAPLLGFEAFLANARLFGRVRLDAARLTDLLNAHSMLRLHEARLESLVDDSVRSVDELEVQRSDLLAVLATGPRGDPALRRWTLAHPVAVQVGDFLIGGYAHATPGQDPLASVRERPVMVPLTDAWIEHWPNRVRQRQWIGTVVFNRELAAWIREVAEGDLEFGRLRPTG